LLPAALALSLSCCGIAPADASEKPNIIFIFTDDQAPNTFGAAGNPSIKTPNLDRMIRGGTFFPRTYIPVPQCAPSRAAVLTGRYPHEIGVLSNTDPRLGRRPNFATVLQRQGYRCGLVGKWHFSRHYIPHAGFRDFWVTRDKSANTEGDRYIDPLIRVGAEKHQEKGWLTDIITDYALQFIDESSDKPFMLWLCYYAPHRPLTFPPDPHLRYDPAQVPLPRSINDNLHLKPPQQARDMCHAMYAEQDRAALRENIAKYYSMITALDTNVGRILARLEQRKLDRNTLVIFMSDNGWMLGEHQLYSKGPMFYDELVRMPLIFYQPGVVPAGRRSDALVSLLDIFPTITTLGGARKLPPHSGVDIWPLVQGKTDKVRDRLFFEYRDKKLSGTFQPMLGVVSERFKYVRYMKGGQEELYNVADDPQEMKNLVHGTAHRRELLQHRAWLDEFAHSIDPPFWKQAPR